MAFAHKALLPVRYTPMQPFGTHMSIGRNTCRVLIHHTCHTWVKRGNIMDKLHCLEAHALGRLHQPPLWRMSRPKQYTTMLPPCWCCRVLVSNFLSFFLCLPFFSSFVTVNCHSSIIIINSIVTITIIIVIYIADSDQTDLCCGNTEGNNFTSDLDT